MSRGLRHRRDLIIEAQRRVDTIWRDAIADEFRRLRLQPGLAAIAAYLSAESALEQAIDNAENAIHR